MGDANFFKVFEAGLNRKQWGCSQLSEEMKSAGHNISLRSLQRYKRQETKPNHKTAKLILECLDIVVTDDEIDELLANCEKAADYEYGDARYIERGIRLRVDRLSAVLDDESQIIMALRKRIRETQTLEKPNFNRYLAMLIQKDIDEHILPKTSRKRREDDRKRK